MKRKIICFFILSLLVFIPKSYSSTENTLNEQKDTFEINSFITNAKKYVGDSIFKDTDINNIFESAIKGKVNNKTVFSRVIGALGKEVKNTIISLTSILVVIVIHSILKSVSESLENDNIAKLIYYVQYIIIATIIMNNFSEIIAMVKESASNMVGFINILIPLLTSLMLFTGSIATTSVVQPVLLFSVNLIGNLIQNILIPLVLVIASLSIISKITDRIQIDKLTKFMKSGVTWVLGIGLTIFVAVVSLEGSLSSSVDGITAKTTKAVVSSAIPIVGKILGDAVDSVLGCGIILKNAVGIVGVIIIVAIAILPIIKLALMTISYKLLARNM